MVPYLGVVFVPFTLIIGTFGVIVSFRRPELGGGKLALTSACLSLAILIFQIFLWWLLYIVPELGHGN